MALLSSQEIANITSDIRDIVRDTQISTSIQYQMSGITAEAFYEPTDQEIISMYARSSVSAFKGSYSVDEVEKSKGLIEYGDVKFIIMQSSVTGILTTVDRVFESGSSIQSGTTYQVVGPLSYDPLKICYFIHCRTI